MKKSTITLVAIIVAAVVVLTGAFVLFTDNNISNSIFTTTTTTNSTTTTTTGKVWIDPDYEPIDYFKDDISSLVALGQYRDLIIETEAIEASEEGIDFQIAVVLAYAKEFTKVREGVINKNVIFSFDYTGYLKNDDGTLGEKFSNSSATDQLAYIDGNDLATITENGISGFIDGFAQGIEGHSVGETFKIDITFPDSYPNNPNMAGKKTVFEIKINYIAQTNFSDGWVKEYTKDQYKTCEEYRQFIKESINNNIKQNNLSLIWKEIIENSVVNIPEEELDYYYGAYRQNFEYYASIYGMTYEEFLKNGGAYYFEGLEIFTDEELVEYIKDTLTQEIVRIAVIKAENLEVTDEEFDLFIEELVALNGKTKEETIEGYGGEKSIKKNILIDEVTKLIYEINSLTEKSE
jgi:trigger factor